MGKMWSSQPHQNQHCNLGGGITPSLAISGAMLEREASIERLVQLREENTSLKKTTNHQEDTIRQLRTKLSRVIALAKRASADTQTTSQIRYHEDSLRQLAANGATMGVPPMPAAQAGNNSPAPPPPTSTTTPQGAPSGATNAALPATIRQQIGSSQRARSASRGRLAGSATARSRSRSNAAGGVSLDLLEEAHNEICTLKAELKRREEEVHEWETVAQKLNCELSSERKLRTDAEQEVCRLRVSLVKAHKEMQIKGTQVEALEAEMDACRMVREKAELQSAKLLEVEQALAAKESQASLLQELQQRIGELERERDIVEDSNRKLIRQSEELKERMAAQAGRGDDHQSDETQTRLLSGQHDSGVHAPLSDDDLAGSMVLQDMLIQLQDKFENLEKHIEQAVDDVQKRRSSSSGRSSHRRRLVAPVKESRGKTGSSGQPMIDNHDRTRSKDRLCESRLKAGDRHNSLDANLRDHHHVVKRRAAKQHEAANPHETGDIYHQTDAVDRVSSRRHNDQKERRTSPLVSPLHNGSKAPLPTPRRRLGARESPPDSVESSSSSQETFNNNATDNNNNISHSEHDSSKNNSGQHSPDDSGTDRLNGQDHSHPERRGSQDYPHLHPHHHHHRLESPRQQQQHYHPSQHDRSNTGDGRDIARQSSSHPARLQTTPGRTAIVKNEATQTSQSEQRSLMAPANVRSSSRIKQTTKILSSDDSVSEMTELSLANSDSPHFEIHIDKVRFTATTSAPLPVLAKRNVVVTWELADFEAQSTPVGHLCSSGGRGENGDELVFNCTARYILEDNGDAHLSEAVLSLQVATVDGEVLGDSCLDVAELQRVLGEPKKKHSFSAKLDLQGQPVGVLEIWLRYTPRCEAM